MDKYEGAIKIMTERFSQDSLIAVATVADGQPFVRTVDGYYEDGAFYVVTYTLSNKMKQIAANSDVAVCGQWFTGHGIGTNLGHVLDESNAVMMTKLRQVFAGWYTAGHVDESDPNTCLLRISLTSGVITDNEKKYGQWQYVVNFANKSVKN